jgi:hypothetical protein
MQSRGAGLCPATRPLFEKSGAKTYYQKNIIIGKNFFAYFVFQNFE